MDIRKIKNLIFDFGGVLVELDKARCLEAFNRLGFAEAEKLIDAYSQQGLFGQLEEGTIMLTLRVSLGLSTGSGDCR